jgi:MscS family membrane protein
MKSFITCLLILILVSLSHTAHAQSAAAALFGPPKPKASTAASTPETPVPEIPKDALGRETPRGTLSGFLTAVGQDDYAKAAMYLNLSYLTKYQAERQGPDLAKGLQTLMDNGAWITPASMVSNDPAGKTDDDLPENTDKLGSLKSNDMSADLLVERVVTDDGTPSLWLISPTTVREIPALVKNLSASRIDRVLPDRLIENKIGGVPIGHWAAMLALIAISYFISWAVVTLLCKFLRRVWKNKSIDQKHVIDAFQLPVILYMSVWIFVIASVQIGVSVIARQYFSHITIIVAWVSLALLMWKLIDALSDASQKKLILNGKYGALSGVQFFRRMAKFVFSAIAVFVTLGTVGIDVTAGLAALGIGGLALAFGAQKTIENFIGSIMVIFDQPVRIGDYCKVGDISGTIEDIGMRSTRIRTLNRTLVTIPNGDFSAQRIENFAHRDQFRIYQTFDFRMDTSAAQLRHLIVEFRSLLFAHPRIDSKSANVKFIGWDDHAAVLEMVAYVNTRNNDDFMEVREDIFLRILDIIEKSGSVMTSPATPFAQYFEPVGTAQADKRAASETKITEMTERGDLPLPKFDQPRIDRLKNSLDYPPKGSSTYKGKKE